MSSRSVEDLSREELRIVLSICEQHEACATIAEPAPAFVPWVRKLAEELLASRATPSRPFVPPHERLPADVQVVVLQRSEPRPDGPREDLRDAANTVDALYAIAFEHKLAARRAQAEVSVIMLEQATLGEEFWKAVAARLHAVIGHAFALEDAIAADRAFQEALRRPAPVLVPIRSPCDPFPTLAPMTPRALAIESTKFPGTRGLPVQFYSAEIVARLPLHGRNEFPTTRRPANCVGLSSESLLLYHAHIALNVNDISGELTELDDQTCRTLWRIIHGENKPTIMDLHVAINADVKRLVSLPSCRPLI